MLANFMQKRESPKWEAFRKREGDMKEADRPLKV